MEAKFFSSSNKTMHSTPFLWCSATKTFYKSLKFHCDIRCQSDGLDFNPTQSDVHRTRYIVMYLEFNPTRYISKDNRKYIIKYKDHLSLMSTELRAEKLFSCKNTMLTNHDKK